MGKRKKITRCFTEDFHRAVKDYLHLLAIFSLKKKGGRKTKGYFFQRRDCLQCKNYGLHCN